MTSFQRGEIGEAACGRFGPLVTLCLVAALEACVPSPEKIAAEVKRCEAAGLVAHSASLGPRVDIVCLPQ